MITMNAIVRLLVGVFGFILSLAITCAVIWFIRPPLRRVLQQLIGDKAVAEAGTQLVLILLGLYGLRATLGYITQAEVNQLFRGLIDLLVGMAGVVQWAANIAALLFIGYSLQARLGTKAKDEE